MKSTADLRKIHDTLLAQAQQLTALVHPQTILKHGYQPPDKMLVVLADAAGLQNYAIATLIEVVVEMLEPKIVQ